MREFKPYPSYRVVPLPVTHVMAEEANGSYLEHRRQRRRATSGMAPSPNIKQRLLREAVEENMGQRPRLLPRPMPTKPSFWTRRLTLTLIATPLFALSALFLLALYPINEYEISQFLTFASKVFGRQPSDHKLFTSNIMEETYPVPKPINFRVFPLRVNKIIIDPGHGGEDSGAVASQDILEKEVTLDIGIRLRKLLERDAFQVLMTRQSDTTIPLKRRVELANTESADLFVSIHANWFKTPTTSGVETYYLGPTDDPHTIQLAAIENKGSGYTLGHFHKLLENVYLNVRRTESRQLATSVQNQLTKSLRNLHPKLLNRGVKMAPFLVLVSTKMPAILAEVSFLSNQAEARLLSTTEYRQGIAQALYKGIRAYTKTLHRTAKKEPKL